jgi:predicted nucleic acid-binding protein
VLAPLTPAIIREAKRALHDLSATASHRIPFQDALIAATVAQKNMTVLHYDGHYDLLGEVLGFESGWVAPPSALRSPAPL